MSITITDPSLVDQLVAARTAVALHNPSGELLGTFLPFGLPPPGFKLPFSQEELERRRRENRTGRPLTEILRDLEGGV